MEKSRANNTKYICYCLIINSYEKTSWGNIHKRLSRTIIWSVDHNGNNLPKRPMGKNMRNNVYLWYPFKNPLGKIEDVTYYMSWIYSQRVRPGDTEGSNGKTNFWQKLWNLDCPPKIKHFYGDWVTILWRLKTYWKGRGWKLTHVAAYVRD